MLVTIAAAGSARAFHSGGVAECGGCHSMHAPATGGAFLLTGDTASDACLSCHEHAGDTGAVSYHVSTADADMPVGTAPMQMTPGGDFGWLKKSYTFVVGGATIIEHGRTHGHNVVAPVHGYVEDSENATAPGGSYPASALGCISCHDPHGSFRRVNGDAISTSGAAIRDSGSYDGPSNEPRNGDAVGTYRLLAGEGYAVRSGASPAFPGVPAAKVPPEYNRAETTRTVRVAYGAGISAAGAATWSAWCGACHPGMHSEAASVHPADRPLGPAIKANYDAYVKTGDMTGTNATAFTSLVPFATIGTYAQLAQLTSSIAGPADTDTVTCMSCHRAHASGWPHMLRWNAESGFIVFESRFPGVDSTPSVPESHRGRTSAETRKAYYQRFASSFASYQRGLCSKCHAKD